MSILDRFLPRRTQPEPEVQPQILTKAPGFAVTQFNSGNYFTNLIEPDNYYEQYVLYTFKAIDYISNKIASAPFKLYNKTDDKEVSDSNPLLDDLESFNPFMNIWEARKLKEIHLFLTGAAYWYIDREPREGKKVEYYPLDPLNMQIKTDGNGLPAAFTYKDADGKSIDFDPQEVIYFKRTNPKNWFEGLSQVKQMSYWTNAYLQGAQYNMSKLGNNMNADKFIVFEGISDDQQKMLEEQMRNKYGGTRNAGKTGILNKEPIIVDASSSQKDLDYVNGMKMMREDILVSFGIPEALFFPSAANANSKEARILFQSDTLEPLLFQEQAVFNEQILKKVERRIITRPPYYFKFDPVVDKDTDMLFNQSVAFYDAGLYTRNQALEHAGEEAVADGDEYKAAPTTQDAVKKEDEEKKMLEKTKSLAEQLDKMLDEKDHAEFIVKNIKLADEQEGIMYQASESLFQDQLRRVVEYLNKNEKISLRAAFNISEEVEVTKNIFKETYSKVMANSNDVGNVEIKQKMLRKNMANVLDYKTKSISGDAIDEIAARLSFFSQELNETTQKELRKLLADGIENGFDSLLFKQSITDLFNGYIDGKGNMQVLMKHDLYIPSMELLDGNSLDAHIGNRYAEMLSRISDAKRAGDINQEEMDEALKALRGLVDPSDPIGKEIDGLLSNVYKVNKKAGISQSRAVTIARTEATFARNLGFEDVYANNPFVKGKRWNSLHDKDVRDSHLKVDGAVVKIGEPFKLDGGLMNRPGDSSLGAGAEEIVNCRCRITAEVE